MQFAAAYKTQAHDTTKTISVKNLKQHVIGRQAGKNEQIPVEIKQTTSNK